MRGDPFWTRSRHDLPNNPPARGGPIRQGQMIFYYPNTREAFAGAAAERAAADFVALAQDEENARWS